MDGIAYLHAIVATSHAASKYSLTKVRDVLDQALFHQLRRLFNWIQIISKTIHHLLNILLEAESIPS